jgi:hypothetical protein
LPVRLLTGDDLINEFRLHPGKDIGRLLKLVREAQAAGDAGGLATQLERAEEAVALGAQLKQVFESSLRHLEPKE